jgi:hypothetical protein
MNARLGSLVLLLGLGSLTGCNQLLAAGGLGGTGAGSDPNAQAAGAPAPETQSPAGAPSPESAAASSPSTPVPTTVEVHSDCSKTTRLFIGQKPKFGSGKTTTIGSNTTMSEGRNADGTQMIWIVDDSDNGLASAVVTVATKKVVVESSCTAFHAE